MDVTEEVGAVRQSSGGRLSVLDVVLGPKARHQRWRQAALAAAMLAPVVFAGLQLGASRPPAAAAARAPALVEVRVTSCPVSAGDYVALPFSPQAAPATLRVSAFLAPPPDARIYGTWFAPGQVGYLVGPQSGACQAGFGSADGGEGMMTTPVSAASASVTMTVRAGGIGPSTDLACPYIPAVRAADEVFRRGYTVCSHPPADVIRQIPTGTPNLYAAAVYVPAGVKEGPADGADPAIALYTAWASPDAANGQAVTCMLAPGHGDVCAASLEFFLATQSAVGTRLSAAHLAMAEEALSSFLAERGIR
jgi:hypothetical protein